MIAIHPARGATLPARQDLQRIIAWCDTDPPFQWLKGIAAVAMAVHPVVPIGTPSPGARAFWTGELDRIVAKLSGGQIPAAWGADFEVEHVRDEDGLVRADWTLQPDGEGEPAAASEFALLFEVLMWPGLARHIDLGPP